MERLATVLVLSCAAAAQRITVNFDFGWRQKTGPFPGAGSCPQWLYSNGTACDNLMHAPSANSVGACAASACALGAAIWQFRSQDGCWQGGPTDAVAATCHSSSGWVGASATVPAPALPSYDDTAWQVIDVPHDFEVTGVYDSGANGGEAFLPQNGSY